jgi:DNA-binding NarL/FixJ family response regulator
VDRSPDNRAARLLLLSERAGVRALFASSEAVGVADADVAVVDGAAHDALEVVRSLLDERPELPVAVLLCCPRCVSAATVRALLAAGVAGFLDLHTTPAELRDAAGALATGATVLHLRLSGGVLRDVLEISNLQSQVLGLVAQGLRDREIGERLHLSPHTVKHRVEQLCRAVRARNRIELAAWAGRNGY